MRFLKFLKKEILHILHDSDSLLLMVLFPFALTLVLGSALSGAFDRVVNMPQISLPIVSKGDVQSSLFINQGRSAGISFHETSLKDAKEEAKTGESDGYITLDGKGVSFYTDNPGSISAMVVRTYSGIFAKQATMANLAAQKGRLDLIAPRMGNYVESQGIDLENEPSSFGYYGITMLTMIMMYGAIQAANMMDLERKERTYQRLKTSPYSMNGVFLAKSGVSVLALLVQAAILMITNRLIYQVDYRNMLMVTLMLIPYALFCGGLGLMMYQVLGNARSANSVLNLLIFLLVFIGGGYVPLSIMMPGAANIASYSPVGLINNGLFDYIYKNDLASIIRAMAVTGGLGFIMLAIAYMLYRKEEGSNRAAGY